MKRKILSTLLLITITFFSVYGGIQLSKINKIEEKNSEKVEKVEEIVINDNENMVNDNNETEVIEVESKETEKPKTNSSSSNKKPSNTSQPTTQKKASKNTTKKKETPKPSTKTSTPKPSTKTSTPKPEKKETIVEKEITPTPKPEVTNKPKEENKETAKEKEVVIKVPDSNNYKNDPAFIKLQKELFRNFKECNEVGENEWRKDSDNVLSFYCEAEYYKGAEAGIRLYIIYNDKTKKKYYK